MHSVRDILLLAFLATSANAYASEPAVIATSEPLTRCDPDSPTGSYTVSIRNTSVQVYCNNAILGGGWMSFASAPAEHWFSGQSTFTSPTNWATNAYSYNNQSYSPSGLSGDYWLDVSSMGFNEILMMTGNGKYWISFELALISLSPELKTFPIESSGNFPMDENQLNTLGTVSYTTARNSRDPRILAGLLDAVGETSWMFWMENGRDHDEQAVFRRSNNGILVFGRYQAPQTVPPPLPHSCNPNQATGTYVLRINNKPTTVFCNNDVNGGGWMSFASSPTSNWFSGDSGSPVIWASNPYSYNEINYSPFGATGDYWLDVSSLGFQELLLITGNGKYWVSFSTQNITLGSYDKAFAATTSENFPIDSNRRNSLANVFYRPSAGDEPWISVGAEHVQNYDWMFWGEGKHNIHFASLRQNNGGILLLGRLQPAVVAAVKPPKPVVVTSTTLSPAATSTTADVTAVPATKPATKLVLA